MNSLFASIAAALGLSYGAGTQNELNDLCNEIVSLTQFVGFYECYDEVLFIVSDKTGQVKPAYPFQFWIMQRSELDEPVSTRLPKIEAATALAIKVVQRLTVDSSVSGARAVPVLSETDNIMCGVRLTGTYIGNPLGRC